MRIKRRVLRHVHVVAQKTCDVVCMPWRSKKPKPPPLTSTDTRPIAAKRFFERVLASCGEVPSKIVTDQLRSYPAAKADIPELTDVRHIFVKAAARVNNRAENSHQPTRERKHRMRGFRDRKRTQAFLSSIGPIRQHFPLKRHLLRASRYRKQLGERFARWHRFTGLAQNPSAV